MMGGSAGAEAALTAADALLDGAALARREAGAAA
jgi:hypothetical protein